MKSVHFLLAKKPFSSHDEGLFITFMYEVKFMSFSSPRNSVTNTSPILVRLLIISCLLVPFSCVSGYCAEPVKVTDAELQKPSPMPDRVILTPGSDPTCVFGMNWRTDTSITRGLAQIAPGEPGPAFQDKAKQISSVTTTLTTDLGEAVYHSVTFQDLSPDTVYCYRVGDGVNWTEWFQFRTASKEPKPFSFIYLGDSQCQLRSLWSRVIRTAITESPKVRFILHAGDLVNVTDHDSEWGEWFGAGAWLNGTIPSFLTPGNHEYPRDPETKIAHLSSHWRPQFTIPTNGPAGLEETAHFMDYQGARIISLNSSEKQAEQVPWLEQILKDNPNQWTIITFHHPLFSSAKGRDNATLRNLWQPIFDKYHVDMVLQGHDHSYARSGPLVYQNIPSGTEAHCTPSGTVYVVSVSGPKLYDMARFDWMRRAATDTQLYQVIRIEGRVLYYKAFTAMGDQYDAFELKKQPGGKPNIMIEHPACTPERLRPTPTPPPGQEK